jgi:hypothetical protein
MALSTTRVREKWVLGSPGIARYRRAVQCVHSQFLHPWDYLPEGFCGVPPIGECQPDLAAALEDSQ